VTCTLVDFHCHLDLYPDFELLVRECDSAGIHTLAVTTTPRAWARNHELASRTRYVIPALGLHPQLVSNHAHEIDLWESLLPDSKYVGEVGLDSGPQYYRSLEIQKKIFQRVLQACDSRGGKVLSVHSVRSAATVLDMIERHLSPVRSRVVLHWFTGSIVEARRAVDLGCYFSVNAQMATGARTGKIIEMLPSDRILTETDGPFTNSGGRQSRPRDVAVSLRAIADVRKTPLKDVESLVVENFKRITSAFE
jgi:TatD DNase family protein